MKTLSQLILIAATAAWPYLDEEDRQEAGGTPEKLVEELEKEIADAGRESPEIVTMSAMANAIWQDGYDAGKREQAFGGGE